MNALERWWLAPIPAVRAWLVHTAVLLLFALDVFREHLRSAWRYGAADFNVAHFALLDALPMPTVTAYVAAMIAIGLAAFVVVIVPGAPRALPVGIALVYAWSWSCSMLDSWQHHYLVSLALVALAGFPRLSARALCEDVQPGRVAKASEFGLVLVWCMLAIVYGWSAIAKLDPGWLAGDTLRAVARDGDAIPGIVAVLGALGLEGDAFWRALARGVLAVELVCAVGYATAPLRDHASGRVRVVLAIVAWAALVLGIGFHAGTALLPLNIGWFPGYMVVLAVATFVPAAWLARAVDVATRPTRKLWSAWTARERPRAAGLGALVAAGALVAVGRLADLPGAFATCVVAALALAVLTARSLIQRRGSATVLATSSALALGAVALGTMLAMSPDVRYDHWRYAAGDFSRRGELARAIEAYERANTHAATPADRRDDRIRELRERIEPDSPAD